MTNEFSYVIKLILKMIQVKILYFSDKSPSSKGLLTATLLSSFALNFPFQQYRHYFWYNPHLIVEKQQVFIFSTYFEFMKIRSGGRLST